MRDLRAEGLSVTLRCRGAARESRRADVRRRCARSDNGVTFIEVLIVVLLLGAVFVVIGSLFTTVASSDVARRQAFAQAELARFTEAVRSAQYQPCAGPNAYQRAVSAVYTPPQQERVTVTDTTSFWQAGDTSSIPANFGSTCPPDLRVQRVTLTVTVGGVSASTTIVKRNS